MRYFLYYRKLAIYRPANNKVRLHHINNKFQIYITITIVPHISLDKFEQPFISNNGF